MNTFGKDTEAMQREHSVTCEVTFKIKLESCTLLLTTEIALGFSFGRFTKMWDVLESLAAAAAADHLCQHASTKNI